LEAVNFSQFLVINIVDLDPDPHWQKMLDPDPTYLYPTSCRIRIKWMRIRNPVCGL